MADIIYTVLCIVQQTHVNGQMSTKLCGIIKGSMP